MHNARIRAIALSLGLTSLVAEQLALAGSSVDPDLVQHVSVGVPQGPAPMGAVRPSRSRQAPFSFPDNMNVRWRARVTGPITLEPVIDRAGSIVVLHERGSLTQLSPNGKSEWSLRLGDAAPSTGPALLSDGIRVVLNHDNRLLRIDDKGEVLSGTRTGLNGRAIPLLPLPEGGLALAAADGLLRLDHHGSPVARASTDADIVALLGSADGVLAVTEPGTVFRFYGTGKLVVRGHFGDRISAVALSGTTLYGITADQRLVSLELTNQRTTTLYSALPSKPLLPWLAVGRRAVHIASPDGTVRGFAASGRELLHTQVAAHPVGAVNAPLLPSSMPPGLADRDNRLMVARAGAETVLLGSEGARVSIGGSACLSPNALTPMVDGHVLLTCRNGELIAMGGDGSPAAKPSGSTSDKMP